MVCKPAHPEAGTGRMPQSGLATVNVTWKQSDAASCLFIFDAGGAGGARACRAAGWTEVGRHRPAGRCRHLGRSHGRLRGARRGRLAGCALPGASMTRLVPEGLSGCPSGSSFPAHVFTAMLVPWHDLKLRICGQAANQHALAQTALNGSRHHSASLDITLQHWISLVSTAEFFA